MARSCFVVPIFGLCLACLPSYPPAQDDAEASFPDAERLERSEACIEGTSLADGEVCGYPSGPYGLAVGDVLPNLELFDCAGEAVQLAQYLPQLEDPEPGPRGLVFALSAGWCGACQMEGQEWTEEGGLVEHYAGDIQFIQALDEGDNGMAASAALCAGWSESVVEDKFPILYTEEIAALRSSMELVPGEGIPLAYVIDANANIRLRQAGLIDADVLDAMLGIIVGDPYGEG